MVKTPKAISEKKSAKIRPVVWISSWEQLHLGGSSGYFLFGKSPKRLIFASIVILSCILGLGVTVALASCGQTICSNGEPVINSVIPENPDRVYSDEYDFDNFAWKTFVALNWPADSSGQPLRGEKIGAKPNNPRVWESYEQILTGTPEKNPSQTNPPEIRLLGGDGIQFLLPESKVESRVEIQTQKPLYHGVENFGTPLVDQLGNYLFTEIRINPLEVAQIRRENLLAPSKLKDSYCEEYDDQGSCKNEKQLFLLECSNTTISTDYSSKDIPPVPCQKNNGVGAIEIKAAWMKNNDCSSNFSNKYYTTTRTIKMKSVEGKEEKDVQVNVALVGFHISVKTSRSSWIWATFEHICNVPDSDDPSGACQAYNFFNDIQCLGSNSGYCKENTPFVKEPYLWQDEFPHAITIIGGEIKRQIPSQITREVEISALTQAVNSKWQKALENSIWENYKLIGTQWLLNPSRAYTEAATKCELSSSNNLANVTLEPYIQTDPIGGSCINCHAKAKLPNGAYSDFSFVFPESLPRVDISLDSCIEFPAPLPLEVKVID